MPNMKTVCLMERKLCAKLKFSKCRSKVDHGQGHVIKNLWYRQKGLVIRNTHAKYESPMSNGKKVMCRVKVFQIKVKGHGQGHMIKIYSPIEKVLSQRTHLLHYKALCLMVRKLYAGLKFSKCRSKVTVNVT